MFSNQILQKICNEYFCEVCDYKTVRKSSYDDHLLSRKHNKSMIVNQNLQKICNEFICQKCNKKYKDNSGLWRHKKKCNGSDFVDIEQNNETIIQKLRIYIVKSL
jgi:ribosomal protein L37AE/L43A